MLLNYSMGVFAKMYRLKTWSEVQGLLQERVERTWIFHIS
jgi:hypothetical protein